MSDIADRLLSTPAHPLPSLEEGYWLSRCSPDASGLLYTLLEELSPAAMAAFDLACCHCQLWKTSRQLLDTAERRLNSSLESRGRKTFLEECAGELMTRVKDIFVLIEELCDLCCVVHPASLGARVDLKVPHSEGICGFPMVLHQISKILNHTTVNKGSGKTGECKNLCGLPAGFLYNRDAL